MHVAMIMLIGEGRCFDIGKNDCLQVAGSDPQNFYK